MSRYYPLCALVAASGLSEAALGRSVGLSGTTLKNARERGLREDAADRYACRAGLVPWLVWPDWLEDVEQECDARSCTRRFVPVRSNHRYCSHRCAVREGARRRYQEDVEFRAKKQAAIRAYREESKRAQLAKKKARYWSDPERMRAERRERYRLNAEAEKARQREYHRRKREAA